MELNIQFNNQSPTIESPVVYINYELINSVLKRIPSGYNVKPFEWSWKENTLTVVLDENRSRQYLNRNHHATLITLGCLLESLKVAAAAQGLNLRVQ